MARIAISTSGSFGDLFPYLAIGRQLRTRGHTITFAVERRFASRVIEQEFACSLLEGDLLGAFLNLAPRLSASTSPLQSIEYLLDHYLLPTLDQRVEQLVALCQQEDIFICSPVQLAGAFAAEKTHIPFVTFALSPASCPDAAFAPYPYLWPQSRFLRRSINRLLWDGGRSALRRRVDPVLNRRRMRLGLPPGTDFFLEGGLSQQLTALAVSPSILPPTRRWPAYVHTTGFSFWDQEPWAEPPDLTAFLTGPTPVIALSLGSASQETSTLFAPLYHTSIEAVRRVGAKTVVFGAPAEALPRPASDVFPLDYAPHARILPRCAALIHHGGIGTAAQAWRAGIPTLVLPGGVDQFMTASLVVENGTGHWQRRERFTATRGAEQLRVLLTDEKLRHRAHELGTLVGAENGAGTFVNLFENFLHEGLRMP